MASETGILNPCYAEILKQEEREGCTDERNKFKKKKKVDGKHQHFSSSVDGRIVIEVFCTRLSNESIRACICSLGVAQCTQSKCP